MTLSSRPPVSRPAGGRTIPRPSTPAAAAAEAARFAERARQRRRTRWIRTGIGLLVAAVVLAAGWVVLFSDVFAVRSVQVAGVQRLTAERVERVAQVPAGEPLARLDTAAIAARVRTLAPVADVDVARKFPNTVKITVTERTPVAVLDTPEGRRLVDAEGVAYAPAGDAARRFLLVRSSNPALTPEDLRSIQAVVAALPEAIREKVEAVQADTTADLTVSLDGGREIVWGAPEQAEFKARVLDVLWREKSTRGAKRYDVSVPEAPTVKR
ncbi:cell division protein FtsQ/DivIB [Sporichthya polymorpha]|uniref:cell division protein FtsQ/DivIB n=1 Tax=Sporichthya polymorpha TaxID=35751 RepID=UPI00035EB10F|nr:FtsQ-type POTRA domain-containing protein [Sporichthya polymorpha]